MVYGYESIAATQTGGLRQFSSSPVRCGFMASFCLQELTNLRFSVTLIMSHIKNVADHAHIILSYEVHILHAEVREIPSPYDCPT